MLKKDVEILEVYLNAIDHYVKEIEWCTRFIRTEVVGKVAKKEKA